jgi:hypothetical protein
LFEDEKHSTPYQALIKLLLAESLERRKGRAA